MGAHRIRARPKDECKIKAQNKKGLQGVVGDAYGLSNAPSTFMVGR